MKYSKITKTNLLTDSELIRNKLYPKQETREERRRNYLLRFFFDSLSDFCFFFDFNGRILEVLIGAHGPDFSILKGQVLSEFLPRSDAKTLGNALRKTFETEKNQVFEFNMSGLSDRRWYQITTSLVDLLPSNEKTAVFMFRDVTDEKMARTVLINTQFELVRELKKGEGSKYLFFNMIENSLQGVSIQKDYKFLYVNKIFADLFGYSGPEEVLAVANVFRFFIPSERNRVFNFYKKPISSGVSPIRYEFQGLRRDGSIICVENLVQVIEWEGNTVFLATVVDISQRNVVEEALRENQRLLQTVFDTIPHWVTVKDKESNYLMVNKAFAKSYGKTPTDFKNLGPYDLDLREEEINTILEADRKVIETGELVEQPELEITYPDGRKTIQHAIRLPLFDKMGEVVGIVADIEDITGQKMMEEQLRQSLKMEAIGTMAGGIAHDFNNILQPILLYSDLLLSEKSSKSIEKKYVEAITRSALRAKDLVSKILLYSMKRKPLNKSSNLGIVAEEVVGLMRSTLPKSITMELIVTENLQPVFCDPSQIHQVLLNFCINGAQAISGQGDLKVELSNIKLNSVDCVLGKILVGEFVRIAISDTGKGMDEKTVRRIFDPFFTTKGTGEGTGLGLSSGMGIVQSLNGGIVVSTKIGKGTTFEIFLPAFKAVIKDPVGSKPKYQGVGSILFVDDEVAITQGWEIQLKNLGYDVKVFTNSHEALNIFKKNPGQFDLVITDQSMPKMDGTKLIHKIREINSRIPVILCTGRTENLNSETVRNLGINAILEKPMEVQDLGTAIREILDKF